MKRAFLVAMLVVAGAVWSQRDAVAFPLEIVNWGGDYAAANQNLQNFNADTVTGLDLDGDLTNDDARRGRNYNRSTTMSPATGYAGTSATFSGGNVVGQLNTGAPTGWTNARIRQNGAADEIEFNRAASAISSQTHAVVLWDKTNFLGIGPTTNMYIDATSSFSITIVTPVGSNWQGRWLVEEGGQLYLSQTTFDPGTAGTYSLTFGAADDGNWALYNPAGLAQNFNQAGATYSSQNFSNITAVGFYVDNDTFVTTQLRTRVNDFSVTLQTPEPSSLAMLAFGAFGLALYRRKK
ncbi:MAG TPA: PEP-CTERM sorting domain-containing protein [Candidatus Brocadiia bacterium]|nr:PEP-CTERM sorting domain-containing protein [Candidatus Brocadiia bacterium]